MNDDRATAWGEGDEPVREVVTLTTPADAAMAREERPYLSLQEALSPRVKLGGDFATDEEMEIRLEAWEAFLSYIFQGGRVNPWQGLKNLIAAVRKVRPELLNGMTATDVGIILGETKAAVSAREIARVEGQLKRWGVRGYQCLGGSKTESARQSFAKSAKGNTNRRKKGIRERDLEDMARSKPVKPKGKAYHDARTKQENPPEDRDDHY